MPLTGVAIATVGRCRLTVSKPVLKAPMVSALKLQYDETLSNFAFNLRRYNEEGEAAARGGCLLPHWLAAAGGVWVLKGSESNRVGPGGYRSPRHRVLINSRDEGLQCVG